MDTLDRIPQIIILNNDGEAFGLYTKTTETSNMRTHLASFYDFKRAFRAGEKIADALGAKFIDAAEKSNG